DPGPVAGVAPPTRSVVKRPKDDLLDLCPGFPGAFEHRVEKGLGVPVPSGAPGYPEDLRGSGHTTPASRRSATTSPARVSASRMAVGWRSIAPFSSTPFTRRYLIFVFLISMTWKKHFIEGIAASKTFSQVCPAVERKTPIRFSFRSGGTTGRWR